MRILYDIFFIMFAAIYLPYLLVRGKLHRDFPEKFGFLPDSAKGLKRPVWIHAVSVGEALLAAKLAGRIKASFPGAGVVVSTTTKTGNRMIRAKGAGAVDAVFYYPLDLGAVVRKVVRLIDPSLYIMMETELWPNILAEFNRRGIPVILANGRISDRSFRNYSRIKAVMRGILGKVDLCCMQSRADAGRITELGAAKDRVVVTGNMKFDDDADRSSSRTYSREYLGFEGPGEVIVAGSTHFSEEEILLDVYAKLRRGHEGLKLVIAPRHIERSDAVESYIAKKGLGYRRFSSIISGESGAPGKYDVLLLDTIGDLKHIYEIATVVFVGGSLVKKGGQNPIEAARHGKPVIFGPEMSNFREISEILINAGAAIKVNDKEGLIPVLDNLLNDPGKRASMSDSASKIVASNRGAVGRTIEAILPFIGARG